MTTQRDNSGALFKNDTKEKPNHADYRGSITINGVEHWLNGWIKEGKAGKFLSLSARPKTPSAKNSAVDFDDRIRF